MSKDDLDRILSGEEEILPSSGFAATVMDAVKREASAPPPIPFPWQRALPGMAAAALSFISILVAALMQIGHLSEAPAPPAAWTHWIVPMMNAAMSAGAGWVALALLLAFVSVKLSMRLGAGRA